MLRPNLTGKGYLSYQHQQRQPSYISSLARQVFHKILYGAALCMSARAHIGWGVRTEAGLSSYTEYPAETSFCFFYEGKTNTLINHGNTDTPLLIGCTYAGSCIANHAGCRMSAPYLLCTAPRVTRLSAIIIVASWAPRHWSAAATEGKLSKPSNPCR